MSRGTGLTTDPPRAAWAVTDVGVPLAPGTARARIGAPGRPRMVPAPAAGSRNDTGFSADGHDGHRGVMHSLGRPPGVNQGRQYEDDATELETVAGHICVAGHVQWAGRHRRGGPDRKS